MVKSDADGAPSGRVDPAKLTTAEAAELLRVPVALIQAHIDAGAPVGADGRMHLVRYAAWLIRRLKAR